MIKPTEITRCSETGMNTASFDYYSGIKYIKDKGLEQTADFKDVREGTHFVVCCGDVMVKVEETDFPDVPRREF